MKNEEAAIPALTDKLKLTLHLVEHALSQHGYETLAVRLNRDVEAEIQKHVPPPAILTDERIAEIWHDSGCKVSDDSREMKFHFARAIESELAGRFRAQGGMQDQSDDPIGELQAEAKQAKLDDFVAGIQPVAGEPVAILQALTNPYCIELHGENWHASAHAWDDAMATAIRALRRVADGLAPRPAPVSGTPSDQPKLTAAGVKPWRKMLSCWAGRDGECNHPDCPQLRDNEPSATGRHCPIDIESEG